MKKDEPYAKIENRSFQEEQAALRLREYVKSKITQTDELLNRKWEEVRDAEKKVEQKLNKLEELWRRIKREEKRLQLEKQKWLKTQEEENKKLAERRHTLEQEKIKVQEERAALENAQQLVDEQKNQLLQREQELAERERDQKEELTTLKEELQKTVQELSVLKDKHESERQQFLHNEERLEAKNLRLQEKIQALERARERANEQVTALMQKEKELSESTSVEKAEVTKLQRELNNAVKEISLLQKERAGLEEKSQLVEDKKNDALHESSPVKDGDNQTTESRAKTIRRSVPLRNRPGRRVSTNRNKDKETSGYQLGYRAAELVCLKRGRQWLVAVEVSQELLKKGRLQLYQNDSLVDQIESEDNLWYLNQVNEDILVNWEYASKWLKLGGQPYLVFKLTGHDEAYGCHVRSPSQGSYLVIAPQSWQRDEDLSGSAFVAPEPTSLTGYQAHFFVLEKGDDSQIAFLSDDNKPLVIQQKKAQFQLTGVRIDDSEKRIGPLFGKENPRMSVPNKRVWEDVGMVIVGEEGRGRKKWREELKLKVEDKEQELKTRGSGWYFVRVYDKNDELIESMDFRFVRSLRAIKIRHHGPVPSDYQHKPATAELIHCGGLKIQPGHIREQSLRINHSDEEVVIEIPAHQNFDRTKWLLSDEDRRQVPITILVPRIWWVIGDEETEPSDWCCASLKARGSDFKATSNKALWVRFPNQSWVKSVLAGFDYSRAKQYRVKVTEQTVAIPFRDFCDSEEIGSLGSPPVKIWFQYEDNEYELVSLNVKTSIKCKRCDFLTGDEGNFWRHIESCHIDSLFRPLTYDEMRKYFPQLPLKIYKCGYCTFYAESDDPKTPTSIISYHIERDCEKVPRTEGPVRISFRPIDDVNEIKENVKNKLIQELQLYHKCLLCDLNLENATKIGKKEHLKNVHRKLLYEVQ